MLLSLPQYAGLYLVPTAHPCFGPWSRLSVSVCTALLQPFHYRSHSPEQEILSEAMHVRLALLSFTQGGADSFLSLVRRIICNVFECQPAGVLVLLLSSDFRDTAVIKHTRQYWRNCAHLFSFWDCQNG